MIRIRIGAFRPIAYAIAGCALVAGASVATAQTFGFATMQPGTLNHTSASAVSKVLKDKAGLNVVVQPTAGESVMIPLISRGEAEFGIANIFEVEGAKAANPNIRLIGSLHPLRGAFWVRKDTTMKTVADLKGKRVGLGYSAMRTLDPMVKAILATGGLTEKDVTPVLIPNVIRGAVGNWARTLAGELGPFGITVNSILPGYTRTARLESIIKGRAARAGSSPTDIERAMMAGVPAARFGSPEEIAAVAAFLASPAASYVNGVNLPVDGGRLAMQ